MRFVFLAAVLFSAAACAQPALILSVENRHVLQEGDSYLANVTVRNYNSSAQFNISFFVDGVLNMSTAVSIDDNHTEQFLFSSSGDTGTCYNLTFMVLEYPGTRLYDLEETLTCIISRIPRKPERIFVPEYPLPALFIFPLSVFLLSRRSD